jgi:serine/threonine-protein kinase HipA
MTTKNFSFRLKQDSQWTLAPAYDVTHAHNPAGEWTYQHLMSVNGKFTEINRNDLLEEANRFGVRRPQALLSDVRNALANWDEFAKMAGLGKSSSDRVALDFRPL